MRVISGSARRLKLKTIDTMETRPTQDRTKETLFNVLNPFLADCRFLDLFAGSGGIGIEALSRGAESCVFIEQNPKAVECIEYNLSFTKLDKKGKVYRGDVLSLLHQIDTGEVFHCIFMDPPYNHGLEQQVLTYLSKSRMIDDDTLIVVEASLETDFSYLTSLGLKDYKRKLYKTNQHVFIQREI